MSDTEPKKEIDQEALLRRAERVRKWNECLVAARLAVERLEAAANRPEHPSIKDITDALQVLNPTGSDTVCNAYQFGMRRKLAAWVAGFLRDYALTCAYELDQVMRNREND